VSWRSPCSLRSLPSTQFRTCSRCRGNSFCCFIRRESLRCRNSDNLIPGAVVSVHYTSEVQSHRLGHTIPRKVPWTDVGHDSMLARCRTSPGHALPHSEFPHSW
jgi:hypothetical protein